MAELNPHIRWALHQIQDHGAKWQPLITNEGPRKRGHCVFCGGQCHGVTTQCETRVWHESALRK
jgi:hypothetical protein